MSSHTSDRRHREKEMLLRNDPRCHACSRQLTAESGEANSAHLVRHRLACPDHVKHVRSVAKIGEDNAVIALASKGREYLEATRPPATTRQYWFVDGQRFDFQADAEKVAIDLANLLGSNIEILIGLVNNGSLKRAQVVRPGGDARAHGRSYHRERRFRCDFVHERR